MDSKVDTIKLVIDHTNMNGKTETHHLTPDQIQTTAVEGTMDDIRDERQNFKGAAISATE
jgi:hypothetical protein